MVDQVITKQELIDAQKDAQTLEDVINGPSGELIETRLGRQVYTLASVSQINTMTREEVSAALSLKAPQATTYTKIEVDNALSLKAPQSNTYTKTEVDATFAAYVGGRKAYTTLALAQAAQSSLPANTVVEVTNDPTASNNGTYQWNGTILTKSAYDPLTQAKSYTDAEFIEREQYSVSVDKKPYDFAIIDNKGQIGFYVANGEDLFLKNLYVGGNIDVQALALKTLTVDTDLTLLGTQFFKGVTKDFFTQVNDQGQVLSKIDQFGNAVFNDVNANTARIETLTVENLNYKAPVEPFTHKYQNVLILSEGQSLGKGIQGGVISTTQKYNDKMFYGGCSVVTPKNTTLGQFSSFVPLVQASASSADGGLGEIPVQAATEIIHQLLEDNAGNLVFVGASNAVGGQTIDYLSTTAFTSYVDPCINNALALSQVESKSIGIPAFLWTHGNASAGDTAYKTKLLALRQQYDSKAKSAFNQSEDVRCITYQYTNNSNPSVNKVTDAIYSILKEDTPNFTIACPDYHLPYSTDDVHLRAYGYKLLGAYYGLVYKKVVIDGEDWKPLYPISVFRQGKLVQIKFHVPNGNLVLDTNTGVINVLSNYGFDVVKSDLSPIAINDVKVVGSDTVVITCAEDVPSGSIVRYARKTTKSVVRQNTFSGFDFTVNNSAGLIAGGSLRDTQGEDIQFNINTDQLPVMYKLHNWCISFSETLA